MENINPILRPYMSPTLEKTNPPMQHPILKIEIINPVRMLLKYLSPLSFNWPNLSMKSVILTNPEIVPVS